MQSGPSPALIFRTPHGGMDQDNNKNSSSITILARTPFAFRSFEPLFGGLGYGVGQVNAGLRSGGSRSSPSPHTRQILGGCRPPAPHLGPTWRQPRVARLHHIVPTSGADANATTPVHEHLFGKTGYARDSRNGTQTIPEIPGTQE
jgi:hypothetical protein